MKKAVKILSLVIIFALFSVLPVFADGGHANVKGEVESIDLAAGSLSLQPKKGELITVVFAEGEDLSVYEVGESILVKGVFQEDGTVLAERVLRVGPNRNQAKDKEDDSSEVGGKITSAYCSEDKQEKYHPFAAKLADKYGVTEEWVMSYFCDGVGMGAIMLALLTAEKSEADPESLLGERVGGKGWGQIWKGLGLIGAEKDGESPPGHLKRPDHAGPKDKDK